ncbi:hypothetical protein ACIRQH_34835 [Streptomyces sp. NPDC102279]|uniref:hypothetical protein n=1 Tax=Streptomyces sp. NPDC102279 TaxID=3366153 RepID=UPI00380C0109
MTETTNTETDEQRADRKETEREHAAGIHTHCGLTCEVDLPTEHLRNFVIAKGYPGTAGMLDELLRRARAEAEDAAAPTVVSPPAADRAETLSWAESVASHGTGPTATVDIDVNTPGSTEPVPLEIPLDAARVLYGMLGDVLGESGGAPAAGLRGEAGETQQDECSASRSGSCLREAESETACDTEAGECVHGGKPGGEAQQGETETPPLLLWDESAGVAYEDGRITAWLSRAVSFTQSVPAGQLILQVESAARMRRALTTALGAADEAREAAERAAANCRDAQGCHRVIPCDPGCASRWQPAVVSQPDKEIS